MAYDTYRSQPEAPQGHIRRPTITNMRRPPTTMTLNIGHLRTTSRANLRALPLMAYRSLPSSR